MSHVEMIRAMKRKKVELAEQSELASAISPQKPLRQSKKKKVADTLLSVRQPSPSIGGSPGPEETKKYVDLT